MADTKISDLVELTSVDSADVLAIVDDPAGTPITKKITKANLVTGLATSDVTSGTFADARIAASNVTQHEASLTITESQISDLQSYITGASPTITTPTITLKQSAAPTPTAEGDIQWDTDDNQIKVGDGAATLTFSDDTQLAAASHTHATSDITSGTFADARIAESNVTQHQAALSITEDQIQVSTTDIFLGRDTAGAGAVEEISASAARTILNVENGATADQTGAEIKAAYEGEANTNAFTDAEQTKLSGIEAGADVTDEANVTGALDGATLTAVTVATNDKVLIQDTSDTDNLKTVTAQSIADLGGGGVSDGDKGDITVSGGGATWTIDSDVVTYDKMQDTSGTDVLLGRSTAGAGTVEEITCTSAGRAILDDASASAQRTTLGVAIGSDVQAYNAELTTKVFGITIDGAGSAITTGVKGYLRIPYACTIDSWSLIADQSGSIVIDVWKDTYANYPPTVADTIAGTEKPTLSSADKNEDTSLTTWTTSVAAGDVLGFNVDSASTVTQVSLNLNATLS